MENNLIDRAEIAYKNGNDREAIDIYQQLNRLNPSDINAQYGLARSLFLMGEIEQSKIECEKALEIEPDFASAHLLLGKIYVRQNNLNDAKIELKKAIQLNPSSYDAFMVLGTIYFKQEKYQNAIEMYEKALDLDQDDWQVRFSLSSVYQHMNLFDEANVELKYNFFHHRSIQTSLQLVYGYLMKYGRWVGLVLSIIFLASILTGFYAVLIPIGIYYIFVGVLAIKRINKPQSWLPLTLGIAIVLGYFLLT